VKPEFEIKWHSDPLTDEVRVSLRTNLGTIYTRVLNPVFDEDDYRDTKVAADFWRDADRAYEMGHPKAGLTFQCLAAERLFPESREDLPA
jgi:hypothetical protein